VTITLKNVTKRFDGTDLAAVDSVSFEAPDGCITSLLGPSGSGKSTILRVIAGLEEPNGGEVRISGRDVTRVGARERNVGVVFQSYALFKHMNVRNNVAFGLDVRKVPKKEQDERVRELLALVQLEEYAERFPTQLSGGQRQRIALARALATRPGVLLLDEPFGALDTQVRVELRSWLREFHERTKVTTLLVTHDQEEALELSEHVVLLDGGRVAQAGTPHELYDRPATPFVASFLGGANLLSGSMRDDRFTPSERPPAHDENSSVRGFVRPHDVRVSKLVGGEHKGQLGEVERVIRIGGYVKLRLLLPNGESISVQMRKDEFDDHGVAEGDHVKVDFDRVRVFNSGYSI
jgi:sulfate/thiosulfate transport system ATP-binding protein